MSSIVTIEKAQIRPRSYRVTLNNDAIKAMGSNDTFDGGELLISPIPAPNEQIVPVWFMFTSTIVMPYSNIVDNAYMQPSYAFTGGPPWVFDWNASIAIIDDSAATHPVTEVSDMLTTVGGLTWSLGNPIIKVNIKTNADSDFNPGIVSIPGISDQTGIGAPLILDGFNGDMTDYAGGDPLNKLEITYMYYLISY